VQLEKLEGQVQQEVQVLLEQLVEMDSLVLQDPWGVQVQLELQALLGLQGARVLLVKLGPPVELVLQVVQAE